MTQSRERHVAPNGCGGCDTTWTASQAAHCAACHRTFVGVSLFDAHRSIAGDHGACLDPEKLTNRAGERVAFFRGGMFRGPEMTEEEKARRFPPKDAA